MGRETISPGVRQKAVLAAAETRSFARGEAVLRAVGEVELSGRHLGRLAHQVGSKLSEEDRRRSAEHERRRLPVEVENPPELAVIEVDGGRVHTRQPGRGVGARGVAWRESKNAVLMRMHSTPQEEDPTPDLPATFLDRGRVKQLVAGLKGQGGDAEQPPGEAGQPPGEAEQPAGSLPEPPAGPPSYRGPKRLMRTCLSSLTDSQEFGRRLAAEAHRKAFYLAGRRAFVADGLKQNWAIHRRHFRSFTPIVDFLHAVSYVYHAAVAVAGEEDFAWGLAAELIEACWQGRVGEVIDDLTRWREQQPRPAGGEPPAGNDPLSVVGRAVTYLSNNRRRMNYPEYRKLGLPITSALAESLIKEINYRVKGSEMFWNDPEGADSILALRAAALSEDNRLQLAIKN
ncbi:MAG: LysR family transcriptional regulator [Planctomycetota bacterium]